ncbi:MAG TPA: Wzz/FepE/Etk N-terminal domain-containing protein [Flavisolibacter sp.]|nr:Wzz/FepE/Etk N-terminal domain-containing protein [Flavisolibacter sp.]
MPDLLVVLTRRWKFILGLTLIATLVAFVATLLSPKKYLSTATALPANSMVADRARIFNNNIELLYSDFGTADELDRVEGSGQLDTIFTTTAGELNLTEHYGFGGDPEGDYKAAVELKKNTKINRTGYGELKIKVWDKDKQLAAAMCNSILQKIQDIHRNLQNVNNLTVLNQARQEYESRQLQFRQLADSAARLSGAEAELALAKKQALLEQIGQYEKIIDEYQLAASTNPPVLLTLEPARASLWPDKPRMVPTLLISAFATFAFALLMALFVESRKHTR